jgi:ribosome biogenesis protein ERB1
MVIYIYTIGGNQTILVHQLSRGESQNPFLKIKGKVQKVSFHPAKPFFFIATEQSIRVYNLLKHHLIQKLQTNFQAISSIDIHPQGDHLIVGSHDNRVAWFDMDISTKPFKVLK